MFNPSRDDVRRFFCEARARDQAGDVVSPLEAAALKWIDGHPEYHALLDDASRALTEEFSAERGVANPFLHLSMHLALDEQAAIDQPPGVREALAQLAARVGDVHAAAHEAMECLGDIVWQAQRGTLPADIDEINARYVDCLRRRASS